MIAHTPEWNVTVVNLHLLINTLANILLLLSIVERGNSFLSSALDLQI